ncbi:MAG: sigma-E factor negative regulatory protein [Sedimenticolaceae bacterium]|nr:sigma-E factor negative regulatory protein [Sedimenticolaceae bacterium]
MENQTISAIIDGEGSFTEGRQWLEEAASREDSVRTAARYQLIGACMRGDTALDTSGLFERIHRQLEEEPTVFAPAALKSASGSGMKKAAAGFAVAASIAAAVIFTTLTPEMPGETVVVAQAPANPQGQQLATGATLVANRAAIEMPRTQELRQVDIDTGNPDLDRYLRQHQDYIGSGAFGTGFATATMVSYDGH